MNKFRVVVFEYCKTPNWVLTDTMNCNLSEVNMLVLLLTIMASLRILSRPWKYSLGI